MTATPDLTPAAEAMRRILSGVGEEQFTAAAYPADRVEQRAGIFGPAVDVPADAAVLDRLVALAGRDPAWGTA